MKRLQGQGSWASEHGRQSYLERRMDETIIGYGSLMSADGLRQAANGKGLSGVFKKDFLVVNFPKGKRGFWKWSRNRGCFTMDISEFALCCEEAPRETPRPKEGFQCVALVIDAPNPEEVNNNLERIRAREGYPKAVWDKIVADNADGGRSLAEYLWNEYSFGSLREVEWETLRRELEKYRQSLARLDNQTSLCGRHIPVPIRIGKDRFGIVSYAGTLPRGMADALNRSNNRSGFVQYVGQCLLARCHGVDVSDIAAQVEEIPDLSQPVQAYVTSKASEEGRFPP